MKKQIVYYVIITLGILSVGWCIYSINKQCIVPIQKIVRPTDMTTSDLTSVIPQVKVSTDEWKTCRNDEYGYEFKYPKEWYLYAEDSMGKESPIVVRISTECHGSGVSVRNQTPKEIYTENAKNFIKYFQVGITDFREQRYQKNVLAGSTSLEEYILKTPNSAKWFTKYGYVDGEKATWRKVSGSEETEILFFHKEKFYRIGVANDSKDDTNDVMLSTFHFIN